MAEKKNPLVYMDVSVDKVYVGRMIFELFKDVAPATAENFRALCTVEMPRLKHDERGLLTMNLCDRYGIGSHFVITLKPDSSLDRFHVVFGKIIRGFKTLDKITEADVYEGARVRVSGCGEYNLHETRPESPISKKLASSSSDLRCNYYCSYDPVGPSASSWHLRKSKARRVFLIPG
ncbi:peptidyl-prolyl cis-trans isomerase CYP95-like [Neltuma alba]|uniref:peptidyl-prolyl cis-trans isomerase CYP95-like n=1 Tax=Neltuma alba TaxID=207710 RepID=UPI0010A4FDE6|nr:peptidyl-prolyl cis-trans isomerase CYP95-like [Prosopis alba]